MFCIKNMSFPTDTEKAVNKLRKQDYTWYYHAKKILHPETAFRLLIKDSQTPSIGMPVATTYYAAIILHVSNFQCSQICRYLNPETADMNIKDSYFYISEKHPGLQNFFWKLHWELTPPTKRSTCSFKKWMVSVATTTILCTLMPWFLLIKGRGSFSGLFWPLRKNSLGPGPAATTMQLQWLTHANVQQQPSHKSQCRAVVRISG